MRWVSRIDSAHMQRILKGDRVSVGRSPVPEQLASLKQDGVASDAL